MNKKSKTFFSMLLVVFLTFSLVGCSHEEVTCPFTTITWENSKDDVIELEGKDFQEGESNYYGDCLVYPKKYDGIDGTISYMFDKENKLASVVWEGHFSSTDEVNNYYKKLNDELTKKYGDSGFESVLPGNLGGNVWYLEGGNIIIMNSTVADFPAVVYTYVSPDHSVKE